MLNLSARRSFWTSRRLESSTETVVPLAEVAAAVVLEAERHGRTAARSELLARQRHLEGPGDVLPVVPVPEEDVVEIQGRRAPRARLAVREGDVFCVEIFRSFSSSERMSTLERTLTCRTAASAGSGGSRRLHLGEPDVGPGSPRRAATAVRRLLASVKEPAPVREGSGALGPALAVGPSWAFWNSWKRARRRSVESDGEDPAIVADGRRGRSGDRGGGSASRRREW